MAERSLLGIMPRTQQLPRPSVIWKRCREGLIPKQGEEKYPRNSTITVRKERSKCVQKDPPRINNDAIDGGREAGSPAKARSNTKQKIMNRWAWKMAKSMTIARFIIDQRRRLEGPPATSKWERLRARIVVTVRCRQRYTFLELLPTRASN